MDIEKNTTYVCRVVSVRDMADKSNFVGDKCAVDVFAIYTKRHAEMVEKFKVLW